MRSIPDIRFWKLCGSGTGEGFTPVPNTGVYAILATWPDMKIARERVDNEKIYKKYRDHSEESYTLFLSATSARGVWSGVAPFESRPANANGPIAALTRATISPVAAMSFWRRVPDISSVIGQDPNVIFKIGIGEVPLLHQITFSVWPDAQKMANFARKDGPHARAIQAVRDGKWFREELYARFQILGTQGTWDGHDPIEDMRHAA